MFTPDVEARSQPRSGEPQQVEPSPPPWHQRAVPMTLAVLLVLGLLALVAPSVRNQVALSVTRQPDPYVELFFTRPTAKGASAVCTRRAGKATVAFGLRSHLAGAQSVRWRLAVDPRGQQLPARNRKGAFRLEPGGPAGRVRVAVPVPARTGYQVRVWLPGRPEALRVTCPGRPG